jgi:four helix bundle protein
MRATAASERLLVWQISDELRSQVRKLTRSEPLNSDHKLRSQIEDAATEIGRNIEKALATDHPGEFGRFVRLSRAAVSDVQAGLRIALMKRRVTQADFKDVEELLSRLYPALSSLLATRASAARQPAGQR